jgi:cbb3-type cytochrome oxidase subunit 1
MAISDDHSAFPAHAHLNLVGWATMMLFGLFYRGDQVAAARTVAGWHFWIAVLGMICFIPGIAGANLGNATWAIFIIPGALLTLISMLIFAWTVWESARRHGT